MYAYGYPYGGYYAQVPGPHAMQVAPTSPQGYYGMQQHSPPSPPSPIKSEEEKRIERLAEQRLLIMEERRMEEERRAKEKREKEEKAEREAKAKAEAEAAEKAKKQKEEEERKKKEEEAAKNIKKKPLKFRDAVGRKFSFPFELCNTWEVRSHPGYPGDY